jgi:hypothetical protein
MSRALTFFLSASFVILAAHGCKSGPAQDNSETNWLKCATVADCLPGSACVGGLCMSSGDGGNPPNPTIANPTGTCVAPDDGSRAGYHSPGPWLPDCQGVLKREYWRVFAASEDGAYMLPRPDGAPQLGAPCHGPQHPLASIVKKYGLCNAAMSTQQVDIVNSMNVSDAFAVARYLQSQLTFAATPESIEPYPIPSDIIDACALHPSQNSAELIAMCQRESDRLRSGDDIGLQYTGPGAVELAERLNELYGIVIESTDAGACIARPEQTPLDAGFIYLDGNSTLAAPNCIPTCVEPRPSGTIESLPAGACPARISPCNMPVPRDCGCTGNGQPSDLYHCACESGQWECVLATKTLGICLPCANADASTVD